MKKFISFLWVFVLVFNVAGPANAVPMTAWVTNESFSFINDDSYLGMYASNPHNYRVGVNFVPPLNLECSPSPSEGVCEPAGPVPESAAIFFFGAGLVVLSGFRKKNKKKTYHVSVKSGSLAQAAIYR
ncbi:MAG: hypothetical protein JRI74_07555 [Deltaproteobacteria bacterium]|nr:hypothetical protein [Deltaproteobacteria bacterium]